MKTVCWNPRDYAAHSKAQQDWALEALARCPLEGSERILDVGCGDGKVTAELARRVPRGRVVGLDASPEMVAYARQAYPSGAFPNLEFVTMDARRIEFDSTFDRVFSNAALHWMDDHPAFLRGVRRVLRTGGRLQVSCGGDGNAASMLAVLDEMMHEARWRDAFEGFASPYFFPSTDAYRVWLPKAGLQPDRVELVPKVMEHENREGLAGWIRTTWLPYTERIEAGKRAEFIEHIVECYLQAVPPGADGRIQVAMVRLEVEATREPLTFVRRPLSQ